MKALNLMREELNRLINPERIPIELRRRIVQAAKRAKRQRQNPRKAVWAILRSA